MVKNHQNINPKDFNNNEHNILGNVGIEFTEIGENYVKGKMPVDKRTHQPHGLLHGGASVTLAETLGSAGANLCVDNSKYYCVGLAINSNHLRGVREGYVYGKATIVHLGRTTQIWQIDITNEEGKLVNVSRLTMSVIEKENKVFKS